MTLQIRKFVLVAIISCTFAVTVSALSNHHGPQFLTKSISRVEETVQKIGSILGLTKPNPVEPVAKPKLWAVLVAGSNGYYNYRHQVCAITLLAQPSMSVISLHFFAIGWCLSCLSSPPKTWSTSWQYHHNDVRWYCKQHRVSTAFSCLYTY